VYYHLHLECTAVLSASITVLFAWAKGHDTLQSPSVQDFQNQEQTLKHNFLRAFQQSYPSNYEILFFLSLLQRVLITSFYAVSITVS
jgi:hypothetical protein